MSRAGRLYALVYGHVYQAFQRSYDVQDGSMLARNHEIRVNEIATGITAELLNFLSPDELEPLIKAKE